MRLTGQNVQPSLILTGEKFQNSSQPHSHDLHRVLPKSPFEKNPKQKKLFYDVMVLTRVMGSVLVHCCPLSLC